MIKSCSTCQTLNKTVYIASSEYQLTRGMMFRSNFEGAYGMLFVMNSSQQICMWMENTQIPLEQVWINEYGGIRYIKNATAYNTNITCTQGRYVLEVPPNSIKYGYTFINSSLLNATK